MLKQQQQFEAILERFGSLFLLVHAQEKEALLKHFAAAYREHYPERFNSKEPCVYSKVFYTRPDKEFLELKHLLDAINRVKGLKDEFEGIIALDITEYLGHEQEEFFEILLKFLHDMLTVEQWKIIFVVGSQKQASDQDITNMVVKIARYINVRTAEDHPLEDYAALAKGLMFRNAQELQGISLSLVERLVQQEALQEQECLKLVCRDMQQVLGKQRLTLADLDRYLKEEQTLYRVLGLPA